MEIYEYVPLVTLLLMLSGASTIIEVISLSVLLIGSVTASFAALIKFIFKRRKSSAVTSPA